MSPSISRYLKDFSAPKVDLSTPKYFADLESSYPRREHISMRPAMPEIDIAAERSDAREQGRRDATLELQAVHREMVASLREAHELELETLRSRCENQIAAMVYDRYCDMATQVADLVAEQTARVLAPVLEQALLERSVHDMARMIVQTLAAGEICKITVKGPAALYAALKTHLNDDTIVFRHVETDDIDLAVEFGDAVMVTRMAAWADSVRKVLA